MTIEVVNDPLFIYCCDMCETKVKDRWTPPNWQIISVSIFGGGIGQLYLCQECLKRPIVELVNKVTVNE